LAPPNGRYLAVMGNAGDINTWSGIPYHFYQAGRAASFFQGALDLQTARLRPWRMAWNLGRLLQGQRLGGFQYSAACLKRTFRVVADQVAGGETISHFQLFPPLEQAEKYRVAASFYIDLPLTRLFDEYGIARTIGRKIAREAIAREKEGYHRAHLVVCMSSWAARAVCDEYGIPAGKVKAILPGANMDERLVQGLTRDLDQQPIVTRFSSERPFQLGFTGRDYIRKGLDRLVAAAEVLRAQGYPVEVAVMGVAPPEYQHHPAVRCLGFINKATDMSRFVEAVSRYDLGCLLSRAEGLGISTLECLRLGVPVMGAAVGGITDCIPDKAGILVQGDAAPEAIAEAVRPLLDNPALYEAMRLEARRIRTHYMWERTVAEFQALWSQSGVKTTA